MSYESVARMLGVAYDPSDQDWWLTAAAPNLVPRILDALVAQGIAPSERRILLLLLVASVDAHVAARATDPLADPVISRAMCVLEEGYSIVSDVVEQWCAFDDVDGGGFPATQLMRELRERANRKEPDA